MTYIALIIFGGLIIAAICRDIYKDGYRKGWNDCHYQMMYGHLVGTEEQRPERGRQ